MPLEPSHVLLVVPPGLLLELPGREVLLVRALLVVEDEEEAVCTELVEDGGVVEDCGRLGGVRCGSWVGVPGSVAPGALGIVLLRHEIERLA